MDVRAHSVPPPPPPLQSFESFKLSLIATQPPEVQMRLVVAFDTLMKDISKCATPRLCMCCVGMLLPCAGGSTIAEWERPVSVRAGSLCVYVRMPVHSLRVRMCVCVVLEKDLCDERPVCVCASHRTLESTNRDRFTQKLSVFKTEVRNFLLL